MQSNDPSRRLLLAGSLAAGAAALLPAGEAAAQPAARYDWLVMVKAHHAMIARTFDELLASDQRRYLARDRVLRRLGYQLTAHSVAEENILYPALAILGRTTDADQLYHDQAHAKILNAQTELLANMKREGNDWMEPARAMQSAVLKHAQQDEEGNLYPALHDRLSAEENQLLSAGYQREFASVRPSRV